MTVVEIRDSTEGITACLLCDLPPGSDASLNEVVDISWVDPCVEWGVLHRSLGADRIFDLLHWRGTAPHLHQYMVGVSRQLQDVGITPIAAHALELSGVRAGPRHQGTSLSLQVDATRDRPVLIGTFDPMHRGRPALLKYLGEAAQRLARDVGGWIGAALYLSDDDRHLIEYLQFDGMAGAAASQGSAAIQDHLAEIDKYGALTANIYQAIKVFKR